MKLSSILEQPIIAFQEDMTSLRETYFRTAVTAILKNWTALQLAVAQGSAGADSRAIAEWLVEATLHWFASNKVHAWISFETLSHYQRLGPHSKITIPFTLINGVIN